VTGVVRDDLEQPIPGVMVSSFGTYTDPSVSDSSGAYTVTAETGLLSVHADPPDKTHASAISAVNVGTSNMTADFMLARQRRISGTIRRAYDLQVEWRALVLVYSNSGPLPGALATYAAPDVSGHYEAWVPTGSYRVFAGGEELGQIFWPNTFDPATAGLVVVSGADATGKDMVLPPGLSVDPSVGSAGTPATITGIHFYGNNPVSVTFDGSPVAVSATASPVGSFMTTVTIPAGAADGHHWLTVTAGASSTSPYFIVPPTVTVTPNPAGRLSTVTVTGIHFKPSMPVVVTWTGPAITVTPTNTDTNGAFATSFAVPPGTAVASYTVTAATGTLSANSVSEFIATGVVYGAGLNTNGTLGDGTFSERHLVAPALGGLTGVTQVSAGAYHALARKSDGTVWSWGAGVNSYGQLGRGGLPGLPSPVTTLPAGTYDAVAAGGDFSLALRNDGTVWAWGANNQGQLGDGTILPRAGAGQVTGLSLPIIAIAAGYEHAMALANDGTVYTWGIGQDGTIGNATSGLAVNSPTPSHLPAFASPATAIAAGARHSMALLTDGTVRAWGYNADGELGDGTFTLRTTPVAVLTATSPSPVILTGVAAISASIAGWTDIFEDVSPGCASTPVPPCFGEHSLALMSDGTVMAWGLNNKGQLGDGTIANHASPVAVLGLTNVTAIDAGTFHNIALISDGSVRTWGLNNHGQLGDGTTTERHTPVTSMVTNASGVSAGYGFTLALY
jgi:alpha-tubulin suppressor-like RCC1 family protein